MEWKFPSSFDVLVKGSAALSGEKRTMGYKVRWGTFSRDLCNNIDKLTKNLFTFYSLESPTEEKEENLIERLVITKSKSTFVGVKKLCFICNEYREPDSNVYNHGGLVRWYEEGARSKLLDRMNVFLQYPATKFHEAATKFYLKAGYEAHDVFAADIYYHNSCYIKFALKKIEQTVDETIKLLENDILEEFFGAKKRIVHEKNAFLLSDLLEDIDV